MQQITDLKAFLEGAKAELTAIGDLNIKAKDLSSTKSKLEDQLSDEKERLEDTVESTLKKRRNEIVRTYDTELDKQKEQLRTVKGKREKAKNQGIKERISEETAALRKENNAILGQIKTDFKNNNVPGICNTNLFYSLFCPSTFGDCLKIILAIIIMFLVIPAGVYYAFFRDKGTIALIIIYFIDILVFGSIIFFTYKSTMAKHREIINESIAKRKVIKTNEKKIRDITNAIKADQSEDKYDLTSFDDSIANINQTLADITMKKKDALDTFDNVTSNIIADEIRAKEQPKIEELETRLQQVSGELNTVNEDRKNKNMYYSDNYEVYLGKEFSSPAKIDALIDIANHSTATNINEIIDEYRRAEED